MSIIFSKENVFLIDHMEYINKIYENVRLSSGTKQYIITPVLFSIINEKSKESRKRKRHDINYITEEAASIKEKHGNFIKTWATDLKTSSRNKNLDRTTLRHFSKKLFESTVVNHLGISGGNNLDIPLVCQIQGYDYLVPQYCRFLNGCVKSECKKLDGTKYDICIADPPWWNKYIRRLKKSSDKLSYPMMYNEEIASIPIANLLSDTCLIAVWCTNSPSNISAVKEQIFPKWGIEYVTTWFWLKLTIDYEPVCSFSGENKKQPYERLMIGRRGDLQVPDNLVFASVPSSLHSHKPPLLDLFMHQTPIRGEPNVLELFARYLLPKTTSVGYETLKWQHIILYKKINNSQ